MGKSNYNGGSSIVRLAVPELSEAAKRGMSKRQRAAAKAEKRWLEERNLVVQTIRITNKNKSDN
jgi:hypothetical protein